MEYSLDQVVELLLSKFNVSKDKILRNKTTKLPELVAESFLLSIIASPSMKIAGDTLKCSEQTIRRVTREYFPYTASERGGFLSLYLLQEVNIKRCNNCNRYLTLNNFHTSNTGFKSRCTSCAANKFSTYYINNKASIIANVCKRRGVLLKAVPSWANLEVIERIYDCAEGDHVDHIVPLQGKLVCGLHVENNLQYLSPKENLSKGNKWEVS